MYDERTKLELDGGLFYYFRAFYFSLLLFAPNEEVVSWRDDKHSRLRLYLICYFLLLTLCLKLFVSNAAVGVKPDSLFSSNTLYSAVIMSNSPMSGGMAAPVVVNRAMLAPPLLVLCVMNETTDGAAGYLFCLRFADSRGICEENGLAFFCCDASLYCCLLICGDMALGGIVYGAWT